MLEAALPMAQSKSPPKWRVFAFTHADCSVASVAVNRLAQ